MILPHLPLFFFMCVSHLRVLTRIYSFVFFLPMCCLVFVKLIQTRVSWEEDLPPPDCPLGNPLRGISLINDPCVRA